ncbi:SDR family oxidoreductase [Pedobacter endophyticus]|uniref:SDR family oxidoreductase n=1 Tax=Pedobacter endophyticus TaxID=2789740 RepID=A0A7S9KY87_9SPHI|nr:SDR family oxidoreductase [Pedobacter endophyticus]QPH39029.1 SDR family oxidoreductase [Pedobacter endophyticus]
MEKSKRTVVITGASSGAGRAIALEFAKNHDKLVIASRHLMALKELAVECESLGAEVLCVEVDVANYHSVINLAAEAQAFGTQIDVWVNNAGVLAVGEFDTTPMEISDQVIKTNLLGYMHGAHAVLPYFKKQQSGILINNISIGGFLPVPYGAGYSAAKFGLRGFSAALKAELKPYRNIHVCDAFPGFLDTPGIQHAANYTGKVLKPGPIVYDPVRLAQAIFSLSQNPRAEKMVGSFAVLMRLSYGVLPALTRGAVAMVISTYLKQAKNISVTSGNLFNPLEYGHSVHGGWGLPGKPKAHRKFIGIGALVVLSSILLLKHKKSI